MRIISKAINTILNLKDKMSPGLVKVAKKTKNMSDSMKRVNTDVKKFVHKAKRNFNKLKRAAVNLAKSFAKIGISMGTALVGAGAKIGFSEAMDIEGFRVQLETAVKDTKVAAKKMAFATKFANDTPFETSSIMEATARLEAMGIKSEKWLPAIADMAGATNKSVSQSYEAIIDALASGELERLKEFGIRKDELVSLSNEKFGKGVVFDAKGSLKDSAKLSEVLMSVMENRFKGGAEKMSNTAKGLWSTITGVTKTSLAEIVGITAEGQIKQGSLFEMLKNKMKSAADTLKQWSKDGTIEEISKKVKKGVSLGIKYFKKAFKIIKDIFNFIKKHEKIISTMLVAFLSFKAAVKVFTILKTALAGLNIILGLINGQLALTPLGMVAIAVAAIAATIYLVYRNWDKVSAAIKIAWEWIKNFASAIGEAFTSFGVWIQEGIIGGIEKVKTTFLSLKATGKEVFQFIYESGKNKIKGIGNFFISIFNKIIEMMNKIKIEVPEWVPKIGGKSWGVKIEKMSSFATGTKYFSGGFARMNEFGGEIVNLPGGSQIIPADQSQKMVENNQKDIKIEITIEGNVYGEDYLIEMIGSKLYHKIKLALGNM